MLSSEHGVSQVLSESFEENDLVYIEVLISIEGNDLMPNLIDTITSDLVNYESVNVTGFQPSCKLHVASFIEAKLLIKYVQTAFIHVCMYSCVYTYVYTVATYDAL